MRDLAARGGLTCDATDQLGLLLFLHDDPDPAVSTLATHTLDAIPRAVLEAFLARPEATLELRAVFAARGVKPGPVPASDDGPPPVPVADTESGGLCQDDQRPGGGAPHHRHRPSLGQALPDRGGAGWKREDPTRHRHGLVKRLNERDLKLVARDRNVSDGVRAAARKFVASGQARRR